MEQNSGGIKSLLVVLIASLVLLTAFGLVWFLFLGPAAPVGLGWYLFSFTSGLTMIVLACTFPLVFVIVPLSLGKGALMGISIALAFGLGVALTLSMYGVIAAVVGKLAIGALGAPLELVKNWLYFVAGIFAYLFALGELGFINFHLPTYKGAAPSFIQKQQDVLKALLLGLFLGNIGVGCPHPATPMLLTRIAVSSDVFYGWLLFFVHALGRITPLLIVAFLGILGVSALDWLIARKEKIERATGWGMVFVAAFILVLGLFTHDWWVYSGQHTVFEKLTQEELVTGFIAQKIGTGAAHAHDIPTGMGLFDLPLWLGNWTLVFLWIAPLWYWWSRKKKGGWGLLAFSLLLAVVFIHVLPDWFLFHLHQDQSRPETMTTVPHIEGTGHEAVAHEESGVTNGLVVNLLVHPLPITNNTTTHLGFFVNEKPWNVPVTSLELGHEKIMHVIGVRSDLNEFFHIHPRPSPAPGLLTDDYFFRQPGVYKIWSEIKRAGVDHVFGHPPLHVYGPGAVSRKEVSFARNIIVDNYQIRLTAPDLIFKNNPTNLVFDINGLAGQAIPIENYLGVKMHLTAIKDDWTQFIHTHPNDHELDRHESFNIVPKALAHGGGGPANEGEGVGGTPIPFTVNFPEAGLYKIFSQFRPTGIALIADEALTASFWLEVADQPPPPPPFSIQTSRPILTIISLLLIALLGWWTGKFVNIKR